MSAGEEAANTSDQASPTPGSGTGETQAKHIPHPPPQELWSMSGEQQEHLKDVLSKNTAPVPLDH